jgi:glycosyltransferase involved in cell wall biosynthesis
VILCAARLTEVKGVEYLVRAAALVHERHPSIRVMIAGDGPDRTALADLAGEVAPGIVTFIGHRDDLPQLLASADMVAIPSLAEGLPLMLVESMAAGRPIVASRVGGLADVLANGETGLLVPPADPTALAEALIAVVESPELATRLGERARLIAEQEFSLDKMIEYTKEVYLCVLS